MPTIYNADPSELIEKASEELKKIEAIKPPVWAAFVKTGMHKERPPVNSDWWYMRVASVLRAVYRLGPVGVSKLRTKYGSKKRRGHQPAEFRKASGNILRKVLQQLDKAGLTKQDVKGSHKGRIATSVGMKLMNSVAKSLQEK